MTEPNERRVPKIKPCPFCDGGQITPNIIKHWSDMEQDFYYNVLCRLCGGQGGVCKTKKEAIIVWNKRRKKP